MRWDYFFLSLFIPRKRSADTEKEYPRKRLLNDVENLIKNREAFYWCSPTFCDRKDRASGGLILFIFKLFELKIFYKNLNIFNDSNKSFEHHSSTLPHQLSFTISKARLKEFNQCDNIKHKIKFPFSPFRGHGAGKGKRREKTEQMISLFFLLSDTFPHNLFSPTFIFIALPFSPASVYEFMLFFRLTRYWDEDGRGFYGGFSKALFFSIYHPSLIFSRLRNILPLLFSAGVWIYIIIVCIICFLFIFHTFQLGEKLEGVRFPRT